MKLRITEDVVDWEITLPLCPAMIDEVVAFVGGAILNRPPILTSA
jgi:hypothetical protein